jgi:ubiquinone/menaquinone biosynthesis C-methylase UbiE
MPAYAAAVAEAEIPIGGTALDAGCGTGRALPALRAAVGPTGTVLGVDITPQMLAVARATGRAEDAALVLADARQLPLADAAVDAIFAAGLVPHLFDAAAGLAGLARVTRPGGRLAIFHPTGRAALAARHGRTLRPDEPLAEAALGPLLAGAGWRLDGYDDQAHRFLALATRC